MTSHSDDNTGALAGIAVAVALVAASGLYVTPVGDHSRTPGAANSVSRDADATEPPTAMAQTGRPAPTADDPRPTPTLRIAQRTPVAEVPVTASPVATLGQLVTPTTGLGLLATGQDAAPTRLPRSGPIEPPEPFFSMARPFEPVHDVFPSGYYPYGTTAGGQYLMHHGVDIGNPLGTSVLAIAPGLVVHAGSDADEPWGPYLNFYGNLVVVRHDAKLDGAPLHSLYGHLIEVNTEVGQRVETGEAIGLVGAEGIALGPHLHLEIRMAEQDYGATLNPQLLLQPVPGRGAIVGRLTDHRGRPLNEISVSLYAVGPTGETQWAASTTTYPAEAINPSSLWNENFVLGDWPTGDYVVSATVDGRTIDSPVTVADGLPSLVELWYVP